MSEKQDFTETLRFATLAAHQMKSPVSAIKTMLQTLLGGYAGPLTAKQKELLAKAEARCDQALESVARMLAIGRALEAEQPPDEMVDVVPVLRRALVRYAEEALKADISLSSDVAAESVFVRADESALYETFSALLENALKYTPEFGRIRCTLRIDARTRHVQIAVADSGVGIPEEDRGKVFEPFFRTASATAMTFTGTGLGLSFVKAVVRRAGGAVRADQSDLGGAEIGIELPCAEPRPAARPEPSKPGRAMKVVIVGGVAAGPKVASKVIRMVPDADVTVVEKGKLLSYAGCGLPYYVSGVVTEQKQLMATPVGVVRDPVFFHKVKNFHVMNQTEAVEIDRRAKRLRVKAVIGGRESWLEYDKLVLATGATPVVPPIPNVDLDNVFTLHGVHDAEGFKTALADRKALDVVIIGGGLIGVEITEALVQKGSRVTIVEMLPQILGLLDWEIAKLVEQHMESRGVKILTDTRARELEGEGRVRAVVTDRGRLPADIVVLAAGVRPNVALARGAGLQIGVTGAIKVDPTMRTSDPDVFAAGDCAEQIDLLTGEPCYVPLGSTANKQGRVAAVNICGGNERFPGVLGTTICRVFDYCVARTGLTELTARQAGYDAITVLAPAPDREHFVPGAADLLLKLVVDRHGRRLLGVQATGPGAADKRIDVAAMAIAAGMTVDQLANADLCYAPPYAPAMDNIITAANVARNKLDGYMVGVSPMQLHQMQQQGEEFLLLDVRSPHEHEQVRLPGAVLIPLGSLRGRLGELPKDKPIVTFCNISLRGYEAALILKAAGFPDVRVLDGGLAMWPYEKLV